MEVYKYGRKTFKYDYETYKLGRVAVGAWITEFDFSTHILPEIWEDKERLNKFLDTWTIVMDNDTDAYLKNFQVRFAKEEC